MTTEDEFVLVPREPTPRMIFAGRDQLCRGEAVYVYEAMLSAAPKSARTGDIQRDILDQQVWNFCYDMAFKHRQDYSLGGKTAFKRAKTIGVLLEGLCGDTLRDGKDGLESANSWAQDHPDDASPPPLDRTEVLAVLAPFDPEGAYSTFEEHEIIEWYVTVGDLRKAAALAAKLRG